MATGITQSLLEEYMRIAIQEAQAAKIEGENPFGAVLLDPENRFCHKAHTVSIQTSDPTAHAEVEVIREYCRNTKKVYLKGYTLICSAEPCIMCSGAIKWSKIENVFYSVSQADINRISGGRPKPSCESLINTGAGQIHIEGGILYDEGIQVFSQYQFIPLDTNRKRT